MRTTKSETEFDARRRPTAPLVERLFELSAKGDRGALAALRSGLGKPPGSAVRMLPLVAPFLESDHGPRFQAAFVIASLFAMHPVHAEAGSLGASLRRAVRDKHNDQGVEARLVAALDADPEDLPRHLQGLISLCQSANAPVDWHALYWDLCDLLGDQEGAREQVRVRWARDFWHKEEREDEDPNDESQDR